MAPVSPFAVESSQHEEQMIATSKVVKILQDLKILFGGDPLPSSSSLHPLTSKPLSPTQHIQYSPFFIPARITRHDSINRVFGKQWKVHLKNAQSSLLLRFQCHAGKFLPPGFMNVMVYHIVKRFKSISGVSRHGIFVVLAANDVTRRHVMKVTFDEGLLERVVVEMLSPCERLHVEVVREFLEVMKESIGEYEEFDWQANVKGKRGCSVCMENEMSEIENCGFQSAFGESGIDIGHQFGGRSSPSQLHSLAEELVKDPWCQTSWCPCAATVHSELGNEFFKSQLNLNLGLLG